MAKARATNVSIQITVHKIHHFCCFGGAPVLRRALLYSAESTEATSMWSVKQERMKTMRISITEPHNKTKRIYRLFPIFDAISQNCVLCAMYLCALVAANLVWFSPWSAVRLSSMLFLRAQLKYVVPHNVYTVHCTVHERINLFDGMFLNLLFLIINKSIYTHFM